MEHGPFSSMMYLLILVIHYSHVSSPCARTDHILVAAVIEDLCHAQRTPRKWTELMIGQMK
jgi:hypothetical protein